MAATALALSVVSAALRTLLQLVDKQASHLAPLDAINAARDRAIAALELADLVPESSPDPANMREALVLIAAHCRVEAVDVRWIAGAAHLALAANPPLPIGSPMHTPAPWK